MTAAPPLFDTLDNPTLSGWRQDYVVSDSTGDAPVTNPDGTAKPDPLAPIKGAGPLLEDEKAKAAKKVVALWKRQNTPMSRRSAYWELYGEWRRGRRGIFVQKRQDVNQWKVYGVPGSSSRAMPDQTDAHVRRTVANLLADDPVPEGIPASDSPEDRDAAEFATRLLVAETGPECLNVPQLLRNGLDKAGTFCSTFFWVNVDPMGKGFDLEQRMAAPNATDAADPLTDPTTGVACESPILRYVAEDGRTLTDDATLAARRWKPGLQIDALTGRNCRFLPETAKGIADADGMIVARYTTKGALVSTFPAAKDFTDAQWRTLSEWKPEGAKKLLPRWARDYLTRAKDDIERVGDDLPDDTPILTMTLYLKSGDQYKDGAYVVVSKDELLHRQKWTGSFQNAQGKQQSTCLMVPIAQLRWWDDTEEDDPYGGTVVEKLGPADEVWATQMQSELDWAFRFNNPNVFLPITSPVQPRALQLRDGSPIPITSPQDIPTIEKVPAWPASSRDLRNDMTELMQQASGITMNTMETPNVNSGAQGELVVAQQSVNLHNTRANLTMCYERLLRIIAEQVKCFYSVPDKVSYQGEDGAYKEEEWTGADLKGAKDFRLARGSMTGLNPMAKQQYIANLVQLGLDPAEAKRLITNGLSGQVGAQDNPYLLRVRRQITRYLDGPLGDKADATDAEGADAVKAYDAQTQAFQQAQQAAQQAEQAAQQMAAEAQQVGMQPPPAQAPAPLPPAPFDPFAALPIDEEPAIATIRHAELSRGMVRAQFAKYDGTAWQQTYLAAYDRAKQAAGILTVAEQGEQAKAQADAAAKAEADKAKAKTAGDIEKMQVEAELESQVPAAAPTLNL